MKADGFGQAATIHSELFALNNARRQWGAKTVVIVDEAATRTLSIGHRVQISTLPEN
jgi:hypothetical protein